MQKFIFVTILSFYVCQILSAIMVNNQDINNLIKPGQVLMYDCPDADNIFMRIKDGNITIGGWELTNVAEAQAFFNELNNNKNEFSQNIAPDMISLKTEKNMSIKKAFFSSDKGIIFDVGAQINLDTLILQSKEKVAFLANQLNIQNCFFNVPWLQIESNIPNSLCQVIRFTFNKDISFSVCAQGHINFESNETLQDFIVIGASQVEILFSPEAFKNNQKPENKKFEQYNERHLLINLLPEQVNIPDKLDAELYAHIVKNVIITCVDIFLYDPENSRYLLVKRKQKPAQGMWWLPGGRQCKGESFFDAAKRKCKEELSVEIIPLAHLSNYSTVFSDSAWSCQTHTNNQPIFAILDKNSKPVVDENHDTWQWFDINQSPRNSALFADYSIQEYAYIQKVYDEAIAFIATYNK